MKYSNVKLNFTIYRILAGRNSTVGTCIRYELHHQGIQFCYTAQLSQDY